MDIRTYANAFYVNKAASGRAEGTIENYIRYISAFIKWSEKNGFVGSDLTGITGAETIEAFLIHERNRGLRETTVAASYTNLRILYHWIEKRYPEIHLDNPFRLLTAPTVPSHLPKAITPSQFHVLLHSIEGDAWIHCRDRTMIKMLFQTGVRSGELLSLCTGDVEVERRRMRITRWKMKYESFIPISRSLAHELATWLNEQRPDCDHDGLWPTCLRWGKGSIGGPLASAGLQRMLQIRCRQAGLPVLYPHAFRHGCAVAIIERGGDISLVKDLLGHQDIKTTAKYLRFHTDDLIRLYDRVFE